jgi:hypothetical protein
MDFLPPLFAITLPSRTINRLMWRQERHDRGRVSRPLELYVIVIVSNFFWKDAAPDRGREGGAVCPLPPHLWQGS